MDWNNKEEVLHAVERDGLALQNASDELKNDKEVVWAALKENRMALRFASDELKNDKDFVLKVVKQNGWLLGFASDKLKNDKEVVLAAVKGNVYGLEFASDEIKNDKEFMLAAVKGNVYALEFASDKLKKDKDFILSAIEQNPYVTSYIPKKLLRNKEVKKLLKESLKAVKHADELEIGNKTIDTFIIGERYAARKRREIEDAKPFTKLGLATGIVLGIGGLAAMIGGLAQGFTQGSNSSSMVPLVFGGVAALVAGGGLSAFEGEELSSDSQGLIDRAIANHYDKLSNLAARKARIARMINRSAKMEEVLRERGIKIEEVDDEIQ